MGEGHFYEFGPFRQDIHRRRLVKGDEAVTLTPKLFDILVVLVENNQRVVDKEELFRAVWPDSFVEESNLTQSVHVLRKTLGESAAGARYIETVPKRGYRFSAPVREIRVEETPLPTAEADGGHGHPAEPPWRTRRRWLAAAAVATVAIPGGAYLWKRSGDGAPKIRSIAVLAVPGSFR